MENAIIIKIESGVVADIYYTNPLKVVIVDYDMIEGGETFERRVAKAVISMTPEQGVRPEDIDRTVTSLVLECRRPADRGRKVGRTEDAAVCRSPCNTNLTLP
jgi:hypothetical protein